MGSALSALSILRRFCRVWIWLGERPLKNAEILNQSEKGMRFSAVL